MGRTIIINPPPGVSCALCWGVGRPFGAGPTPSVVTAVFSGILRGDDWTIADPLPPNGSYQFVQDAPCTFVFDNGREVGSVVFDADTTVVALQVESVFAFIHLRTDPCVFEFENQQLQLGKYYAGLCTLYL